MNKVNKPNKDGFIVIDFDGHVKAECRIENGNIIVEMAMNGYGEPLTIK